MAWRRRRRHASRDLIAKYVAEPPVVVQAGGEENRMEDCRAGRRGHKMLRSSPHPKPPTGYPREAVGDLLGLKEKMVGDSKELVAGTLGEP